MRTIAILPLLAATVLAAQDVSTMSGMPDMDMSEATPATITVRVDSAQRMVVLTAGPYRVSGMAHGMSHDMRHERMLRFTWPVRGYLRGYAFEIRDSAGNALPADMLHHAHAIDLERRELLVPMYQRLFAAGRETAPVELPGDVGVPLAKGDSLALVVMLHSPKGGTVDGVFVTLRLNYTPMDRRKVVHVWPMHFETSFVAGESNAFDLAPGRSVHKAEFIMPVTGRLLVVGGHLHDYGTELRLIDCKSGKVMVRLKARRDRAGRLLAVDRFIYGYNDDGLKLERGRRYRVEAIYENPTGAIIVDGGMGSLGGPIEVEDPADWPALDKRDPKIAADLAAL